MKKCVKKKQHLLNFPKFNKILFSSLIAGTLTLNVSAMTVFDPSNFMQAIFQVLNQAKDYSNQLQQYQELAEQLQQQLKMVEMQERDLKNLGSMDWEDFGSILYKLRNVMTKVDAISYDMGNVSQQFSSTFKDFDGYYNMLQNASNENARIESFNEQYKNITQKNQNTLNGALQQLELQYQDLDSETAIINQLKSRSQSAQGNLQALQAGNDLAAYQIDEIRRLRVTLMNQTNVLTTYMATKNNEEVMRNANEKKISERTIKEF